MSKNFKRLIPFFILLLLILFVYVTNLHEEFTLDWIRKEQQKLLGFVQSHSLASPLIFIGIYILSVCLVIPDSTILTLLGGLIFPFPLAILYSVFSETIGALIFFTIFRSVFSTSLIQREFSFFKKLRRKFHRHDTSYLLFLRLSHVFPFWLTNVTASYFRVPFWTFIWTCIIGVLPLTYILADAGHSLSMLFAQNQTLTFSDIFTTQIKLSLLAIGLLSLFPIIYKELHKRKKWKW